jgi:hypothetical protein
LIKVLVGPNRQEAGLPSVTLYLEPTDDGQWLTGQPADSERQQLAAARDATFDQPLTAINATTTSSTFAVLMAVDNLLSSVPQRIPGMRLLPISNSTLGSDLLDVLNSSAAQLGFNTGIDPSAGMELIRRRRPAVILYAPKVLAETAQAAMEEARRTALILLDLIALRRGASPRLLAGIVGKEVSSSSFTLNYFWVESPGYTGNLIGGFISGEDPTSLLLQWRGTLSDGRIRLWLSLYSDAIADERWDYRIFRCFNLLEGIAAEILPAHQIVSDEAGNPLLQANGSPYTTDQARGKVFELVKNVAQRSQINLSSLATSGANPARTVWQDTDIWVSIRNAVAHRGGWEQAPGVAMSNRDQNIQSTVSSLASDGTFASGVPIVLYTIKRTVEIVLFAAINGRL